MKSLKIILILRKQSNISYKPEQKECNTKFNKSSCFQNGNDGFMHSYLNGDLQS
jgi:hypothetical protein